MLRQFNDFYCLPMLLNDAFHRGFTRLLPETKAINDPVVQTAVEFGAEDGQKPRVEYRGLNRDISRALSVDAATEEIFTIGNVR